MVQVTYFTDSRASGLFMSSFHQWEVEETHTYSSLRVRWLLDGVWGFLAVKYTAPLPLELSWLYYGACRMSLLYIFHCKPGVDICMVPDPSLFLFFFPVPNVHYVSSVNPRRTAVADVYFLPLLAPATQIESFLYA